MNYPTAKPPGNSIGRYLIAALLFAFLVGVCYWRTMENIRFNQNVVGHLKLAADANTIELAESKLGEALDFLEAAGLTSGYTSVFYKKPTEDIGFWYQNLKASKEELGKLKNADQLAKTNTLIKLRETLLDGGKEGKTKVTRPDGLEHYPHNLLGGILAWLAALSVLVIPYFLFSHEQWVKWNKEAEGAAGEASSND